MSWYSVQPVGVNRIDRFMRLIAQRGELDVTNKNFTNHSVRKTTVIGKLQKAGGASNDKIIAITGHKNEQSIKYYADTDLDDQKSISRKLSRVPLAEMSPTPNCHGLMPSMESGGSSNRFGPHFNIYNYSVQFENMTLQAHNNNLEKRK